MYNVNTLSYEYGACIAFIAIYLELSYARITHYSLLIRVYLVMYMCVMHIAYQSLDVENTQHLTFFFIYYIQSYIISVLYALADL